MPAFDSDDVTQALPAARQQHLLDLLRQRGQVTVAEMVARLGVSRDTVRRDLDAMEQRGLLVRSHGGAVAADRMVRVDSTLGQRLDVHADAKARIGRRAAALVRDGETLVLNGGSTICAFGAALDGRRDLTLVTNNLRLPPAVPESAVRALYVLGGTYWAVSQVTIGPIALPGVAHFSADTAVLGVTGLSAEGLTMGRLEEATAAAAMMEVASRTVVVADRSKFGLRAFAHLAGWDRVGTLVTDAEPPPEIAAALAEAGVTVLVCGG